MAGETGYKGSFVVLTPCLTAAVPNGAIFRDSANGNAFTVKGAGGTLDPLAPSATTLYVKQMEASAAISINAAVSKKSDGKIVQADSDLAGGQNFIGWAQAAATLSGDLINILLVGPNISGAVSGLGFAVGDEIYISKTGGYTNSAAAFGASDSIIKVGIADCAPGLASVTAVDLIGFTEVVARP